MTGANLPPDEPAQISAPALKGDVLRRTGRAAIRKGSEFEEQVAKLYRLLGADIKTNIMICEKKVDIYATFRVPGSPAGHRILVECKDESNVPAQNQRVMHLQGLLGTARKTGDADSAEIITKLRWGDAAKGFAERSGISILTYREKVGQLIDFTPYLDDLVSGFEKEDKERPGEPPLGAYYIEPQATYTTGPKAPLIRDVGNFVTEWAKGPQKNRQLAVLGEYGTGKTSLCAKVAHDLAASYLKTHGSTRIPILLNLREFTKALRIEPLIDAFLDERCGVANPRFRLFKAMNEEGMFLVILDGFDEMAARVDRDTLEMNLQEIEKLAAHPRSKVLLTSRIEYFVSRKEEKGAFRPIGNIFESRKAQYETLTLAPWTEEQIKSFIRKRVPLIEEAKRSWEYYHDQITKIPGLSDLSKRPVLLEMIVKTLPALIASAKPIDRPSLYETYLTAEIKRQKINKRRTLLLSEDARFDLMQKLALNFFKAGSAETTFSDTRQMVDRSVKPPKDEAEAYTRDFLSCSFLARRGDLYVFSHRSIWEYLVAKTLVADINNNDSSIFGYKPVERAIAGFIAEMWPDTRHLWGWIESSKIPQKGSHEYASGNAASVLVRMNRKALVGKDLSDTMLTGADLSFANLESTKLSGALMKNVRLSDARLAESELAAARFSNITVTVYIMGTFPQNLHGPSRMIEKINNHFASRLSCPAQTMSITFLKDNYVATVEIVISAPQRLQGMSEKLLQSPFVTTAAVYGKDLRVLDELMLRQFEIGLSAIGTTDETSLYPSEPTIPQ